MLHLFRFPCFWNPDRASWFFGYWCSGPESLPGDGLLCYHDLEGFNEWVREIFLVKECRDPITAFLKWLIEYRGFRRKIL